MLLMYAFYIQEPGFTLMHTVRPLSRAAESLLKHSHDAAEEHKDPEYLAVNPRGQMPTLIDGDIVVCESLAALFYLEDAYPHHPLMPGNRMDRAVVSLELSAEQVLTVLMR